MKIALVLAALINPVSFDMSSQGYRTMPSVLKHSLAPRLQDRQNVHKASNIIDVKVKVLSSRKDSADLHVTCRDSSVVLKYSKTDNTFCTPDTGCYGSLKAAIIPYCQ